ncbi:MAG: biotin/lipoyl-binding protein [Candidatus Nitrohelix vancouverensis]|uniref:Biotin/lipoyl-binding protein n=1 Tax=Candidatus Nitrohelix vancouverensis TaxID=2705534 RepID=A0A7T0C2I5_9BACT|nr:MAG: biotin/lipoyl-binding protein [Candidatus Nitrohelix vancouverensis]
MLSIQSVKFVKKDYSKILCSRFSSAAGFALLTLLSFTTSCSQTTPEESSQSSESFSLPVQIGRVSYLDVADEVRAIGNFEAVQVTMISSEVEGRVTRFPVDEGAPVKRGDLLVQIDTQEYQHQTARLQAELVSAAKELEKLEKGLRPEEILQLEASVKVAQSALDLARKDYQRVLELFEKKVESQSALDRETDRLRQAEEALSASEAIRDAGLKSRKEDIQAARLRAEATRRELETAQLNFKRTTLTAPYDGFVGLTYAERGSYVNVGDTLMDLIGTDRLKAVVEIPQAYRDRLTELKSVRFYANALDFEFEKNVRAQDIRIVPDSSIYSGGVQLHIDLQDAPPELFHGLAMESLLRFGGRVGVLHVPEASLVSTQQGNVVYIKKEDQAHMVPVLAGKKRDGMVEVKDPSGTLNSEAELILKGSGAVFPGARVHPIKPVGGQERPMQSAQQTTKKSKPEEAQ